MHDADRLRDALERLAHDGAAGDLNSEDRMLSVVRHGDAGDKGRFDGPDLLRPLSPVGHRQAEGLVIRLEDYPVERILCSPAVRCRQTVEPLARDRLLRVELVAALGVDAGPADVRSVLRDRRLRSAVLCTHGETIGQCSPSSPWTDRKSGNHCGGPKGSTWLLQRSPMEPKPTAWWLRPVSRAARVGEQSAVTWKRL